MRASFRCSLADGREIPVVPLICLDDMDTDLAIDGARLGAKAIVTMSNDSWFGDGPQGAQLHLAAAAFRSIETRLPQLRVTSNGVQRRHRRDRQRARRNAQERTHARDRRRGRRRAATDAARRLGQLGRPRGRRGARLARGRGGASQVAPARCGARARSARVDRVPGPGGAAAARGARGRGRPSCVRARQPALDGATWLLGSDAMRTNTLAQIRTFVALFLAPEAAAWCVLLAFAARASIVDGLLVLTRGSRRSSWRPETSSPSSRGACPYPASALRSGSHRASSGISTGEGRSRRGGAVVGGGQRRAGAGAPAVAGDDVCAGAPSGPPRAPFAAAAEVRRVSLLLAIPAFRLHQHIAYGSGFGEYYTFGLAAYVTTFGLWWAAGAIGVVLCAAVLRAGIEVGTLAVLLLRPARAIDARRWLERVGLALLYIGLPAWLLLRIIPPDANRAWARSKVRLEREGRGKLQSAVRGHVQVACGRPRGYVRNRGRGRFDLAIRRSEGRNARQTVEQYVIAPPRRVPPLTGCFRTHEQSSAVTALGPTFAA